MAQRSLLLDRRAAFSDSAIVLRAFLPIAEPEEPRPRPVRAGDLLRDVAQRRIVCARIFEAVLSDCDRVGAAVPLPHEAGARFQAEGWRGLDPPRGAQ